MNTLTDHFERVVVISLDHRPERRQALKTNLVETGIIAAKNLGDIVWQRAHHGDLMPPPVWWKAGRGAWGCFKSHDRAITDAAHDKLDNILVIEDDAVFAEAAPEMLALLMRELPGDWGQLYLGGQHRGRIRPLRRDGYCIRPERVNRTQAYALNSTAFVKFAQHINHAPDYYVKDGEKGIHIDHQLERAHRRQFAGKGEDWETFAPSFWLCGQAAGPSNISGRINYEKWWHPTTHSASLPFVYIGAKETPKTAPRATEFLHPGNKLLDTSFEDKGLEKCIDDHTALHGWLAMIAAEAMGRWRLPAIQHPDISFDTVAKLWGSDVFRLDDLHATDLKDLTDYPFNGLFKHPLNRTEQAAPDQPAEEASHAA